MNIEVAGIKITFGTVTELQVALERKSAALDKEIAEHEAKALNLRKIRKEVLRMIGEKQDTATSSNGGSSES